MEEYIMVNVVRVSAYQLQEDKLVCGKGMIIPTKGNKGDWVVRDSIGDLVVPDDVFKRMFYSTSIRAVKVDIVDEEATITYRDRFGLENMTEQDWAEGYNCLTGGNNGYVEECSDFDKASSASDKTV